LNKEVRGKVEISIEIDDERLLKALYVSFLGDSKSARSKYDVSLSGNQLSISVGNLNIGDLRAFINSNLRLLKVIIEGLKVIE